MSDSENISQSDFAAVCRERDDAFSLLTQYSAEREHNAMQALAYKAERDEAREALSGRTVSCSQCNETAKQLEAMREAIKDAHTELSNLLDIINDSRGVSGWHLNGNVATWDEFEINPAAALAKLQPFLKP